MSPVRQSLMPRLQRAAIISAFDLLRRGGGKENYPPMVGQVIRRATDQARVRGEGRRSPCQPVGERSTESQAVEMTATAGILPNFARFVHLGWEFRFSFTRLRD